MTHSYEISNKQRRPVDKMYFVVLGFAFGVLLAGMGGIMAYFAWIHEIRDDYTSLAESLHIPTNILSLVMVSVGGLLIISVVLLLVAVRCDCSKPQASNPVRCPELATSTQVLTISRETLRT